MLKLALLAVLLAAPAFAAPVCSSVETREDTILVQLGGRKISLVGWRHEVEDDSTAFREGINEALLAGLGGNCSFGRTRIQTLLAQLKDQRLNGQRALEALEAAYANHAFTKLGTESTPENQANVDEESKSVDEALVVFEKVCTLPPSLRQQAELVFPGPDFVFRQRQENKVTLVGVEDAKARERSDAALEELNNAPTIYETDLPEPLLEELKGLLERINQSQDLSDQEIEAFAAKSTDVVMRENLKKQLTILRLIQREAVARNQAIVERLLGDRDDSAMLIGRNHLRDLAARLVAGCEAGRGLRE